ncbi:MAG: zinc-ribbon domain-containing protein, partial [Clostridiaceae bacterium]|nr:zinc-ribbon domain-containing protein [Clostridiaceae bacterium]
MKICPNCNNDNSDEAMFCTKCGTKFENQSLNTDINTTQNTPVYTTPSENQVFQP